jgi:hypothetical protein
MEGLGQRGVFLKPSLYFLLGYGAYTKRMKIESFLNIKNSSIIKWW